MLPARSVALREVAPPASQAATVWRGSRWGLPVVIVLFLLAAITYSVAIPIFEAPDEMLHYQFVKYLGDSHGLPVQELPPAENPASREASQPPLYYALGALLTFWVDTPPSLDVYRMNPHAVMGNVAPGGNKNAVIHSLEEDFPYRGLSLAVHIVRLLSVGLGLITVLATYFIVLEVVPGQRGLAAAAAAFAGLLPGFLFSSGAVNNDNMVTATSSLSLLYMVRLLKGRNPGRQAMFLGVLSGLAALSKVSGALVLPFAVACLATATFKRRDAAGFVKGALVIVGFWLLIAGWWYARNQFLYGELTGTERMLDVAGRRWPGIGMFDLIRFESQGLRWSTWGVFGWFNILAGIWFYQLFDALSLLAVAGLVFWALTRPWRRIDVSLISLLLLSLWSLAVLAGVLRWSQLALASHGRLLYPALPVLGVLFVLGLAPYTRLVPVFLGRLVLPVAVASLAAIAFVVVLVYIAPTYAKPVLASSQLPPDLLKVGIRYGEKIELIGYRPVPKEIWAGETLKLTLYWRSLAKMEENYSVFAHVIGREQKIVAASDSYPGNGLLPTTVWRPGDIIVDRLRLPVQSGFPPALADIEVGLYKLETMERLTTRSREGVPMNDGPVIDRLILRPEQAAAVNKQPVRWQLGNEIGIAGFTLDGALKPGSEITGSVVWKTLVAPSADYSIFVQVLDPREKFGLHGLVAQWDARPQEGYYPTTLWRQGETFEDRFFLKIPAEVPAGTYNLIAGLYDPRSGKRLPADNGTFAVLTSLALGD